MGFFDFLNKPIPGLNKPNPQMVIDQLKEAVSESNAYARKGDKDNALKVLLKYKDLGWDKPNYVLHIATAYYKSGNAPETIKCCRRAIELDPEKGNAYITMGRVLFDGGDYENAALSYSDAMRLIEKNPEKYEKEDHPIACAWYGASLIKTGKIEEGEIFIRKAEAEGYQKGSEIRQFVGLRVNSSDAGRKENISVVDTGAPDTPRMRELYQKLANLIFEMIPEKWSTVYLYGEVLPDSRTGYFFYRRLSDNELIYSHDIPEKCNVDKRIYNKELMDLFDCLADLNKEYAVNFEKVWTNLTFILESNGKFNIKYNYDDVLNSGYRSYETQKIWMYEVMGVEPTDEEGKALIQRYLKSKEKDNESKKLLISKYGNGSEELVCEFESRHGIKLDEEYRRFLVKYNGGDTPNTRVGIRGLSYDLRYLFGINAKENIENHLEIPVWENKRYLPIGEDVFGNYYVIGVTDDKGSVCFCDHEKGFAIKKIADTFGQFLEKCTSEGIDPLTLIPPEEREARLIAEGKAANITDGLRDLWKQEYEKYKDMILEEPKLERQIRLTGQTHTVEDEVLELAYDIDTAFKQVRSHAGEVELVSVYAPDKEHGSEADEPYVAIQDDDVPYCAIDEYNENGTVKDAIELTPLEGKFLFKAKMDYFKELMYFYAFERDEDVFNQAGLCVVYPKSMQGTEDEKELMQLLDRVAESFRSI